MPNTGTGVMANPKRETWLDLLPDDAPRPTLDAMLTRDEVIAELQRRGVDIPLATLLSWERTGVLPRAVRRYRHGRSQMLYPAFAIDAIALVRTYQAQGQTLQEISAIVRLAAMNVIVWQDPLAASLHATGEELIALARAYAFLGWRPVHRIQVTLVDEKGGVIDAHEFPIPGE
jgi:DNA-binding transcriptional MerR regulator